jgi:ADP-heptose:LPS heptosyltransferase
MHIAAAVGTPTVALFGPTAPWRTGPYSKSSEIIRTNVHCSPCFKKKCNHISCMKDIRIETVLAAVDALLLKENQSGGLSH